jgi:hypothetical protein
MSRTTYAALVAWAMILGAAPAAAQMQHGEMYEEGKCTICGPQLSLDGAMLRRTAQQLPRFGADRTALLLRARVEAGSFIRRVGLFATMEFTPADGPSPTITAGLQAWLLDRGGAFNVTGGLGFGDAREGVGEASPGAYVARGWGQVGVRYRTPVHELSIYGQAGAAFSGSRRVSYQLGISHPLAPYTFHLGL